MKNKTLTSRVAYIKQNIDITNYIDSIIPLKKHGSSLVGLCPFHYDSKPSFQVSQQKQFCRCFTCMDRAIGIVDFVIKYQKIDLVQAVEHLEEWIGGGEATTTTHSYTPKAKSEQTPKEIASINFKIIGKTKALMHNHARHEVFSYFEIDNNGTNELRVNLSPTFQKLFEHKQFIINDEIKKRFEYLKKSVAFDSYFNCPAIILRDDTNNVVDIVKYRPVKPSSFTTWTAQKYFYLKETEKLKNRGDAFIFPFSVEMKKLIKKHNFFLLGEGLKNAVVALTFGVPFVSVESSSSKLDPRLKNFLTEELKKGTRIIGAFDGDSGTLENGKIFKGEGAFLNAQEELGTDFNNLFAFDSDLDFADYLKDEKDLSEFEKKFNHLFFKYLK